MEKRFHEFDIKINMQKAKIIVVGNTTVKLNIELGIKMRKNLVKSYVRNVELHGPET